MKKKSELLLLLSTLIILSGCAKSNLSNDNTHVNVQIDQTFLQVPSTTIKQSRKNFSILYLTQKLLRLDDGSIVVYEEAHTDLQYEFEPTTTRSIGIIFDAKEVIRVHEKSLLFAYQVVLHDNRILNVLASQGFDQELKILYGMSTKKLNKMLGQLDNNARLAHYMNVINLQHETKPLMSHWTTWKVHILPLIVPIRRFSFY